MRPASLTVFALTAAVAGCNWLIPGVLMTEHKRTNPAEFDKLAGKRVVVLVWAEPETLFDYPHVRLELSSYIADKLNISPHYLKPAFAFGGSCLPKDTRAIVYRAKELDLRLPLLGSIMDSNRLQVERALTLITSKEKKRIGICGFSFKNGTDDLRESPVVELIERLIGKGYDLRLYDSNVILAALHGANRNYILNVIPHISNLLMDSLDAVLERSELVVIGNHAEEFETVPSRLRPDQLLVDLVRLKDTQGLNSRYDGINWVI